MTVLAISLYLLGILTAVAAVGRDIPSSPREWAIVICWPLMTAFCFVGGLYSYLREKISR